MIRFLPVDPIVEVSFDINAWTVDDDDLLSEESTFLNRPVDSNLGIKTNKFRVILTIQGVPRNLTVRRRLEGSIDL